MAYDLTKVRQRSDWFEVRSNGSDELLGWIEGIQGDAVTGEFLELNARPLDDDLGYIEMDDAGTHERISLVGTEALVFVVRAHERDYASRDLFMKPYEHETPSYAVRDQRLGGGSRTVYTWRALAVSASEAQLLFDFDEFHPYAPEPDAETDGHLMLEEAFHGPRFHTGGLLDIEPDHLRIAVGTITGAQILANSITSTKISNSLAHSVQTAALGLTPLQVANRNIIGPDEVSSWLNARTGSGFP